MAAKFEVKKSKNGQFFFNLKAANGQVIFTSESYEARAGATKGINSVKTNSKKDTRFERKESKKGEPYFVLTATNGEILGRSEMYKSKSSMEKGIASVMTNAPDARVDDLTQE
ncbi:MAG: YegP family protein [Zavarzinella sp.]